MTLLIPGLVTHDRRFLVAILLTMGLSACGGGGGGDSSSPGNSPPPQNRAPTADAGPSRTVVEGNAVRLSAAGSTDTDGTITAYAWTQTDGPTVALANADTPTATFNPPLTDTVLTFSFQLTVTDDDGATSSTSITITIDPSNPPVVNAGTDQSILEQSQVSLNGNVSDTDGAIQTIAWTQISGTEVQIQNADSAMASFIAPLTDDILILEFQLTSTDNTNDSSSDTVTITINPSQPPTADAGGDRVVIEGQSVSLEAIADDPDGSISSVAWTQISGTPVTISNADSASASLTAPATNETIQLEFSLAVVDNTLDSASDTFTLTVIPGEAPVVSAGSDIERIERQLVLLQAVASDVDGSVESYSWEQISGPAVVLTNGDTESASFPAPVVSSVTSLEFEVTATDNTSDSATDRVIVTVHPNEAPVVTTVFPCNDCRVFGSAISVRGTVNSGADVEPVQSQDSVASVVVDAGAGAVSAIVQTDGVWIAQNVPLPQTTGTAIFTVVATDAFSESATTTLNLDVRPTFTYFLVATDPDDADLLYLFEDGNRRQRAFIVNTALDEITKIYESPSIQENLFQVSNLVYDPIGRQMILNEIFRDIRALDIDSGTVSVISGTDAGNGPSIDQPRLMKFDADDHRLVVYDDQQKALYLVDPVSGDRTLRADNSGMGTGPDFDNPLQLAVDAGNNRAYLRESAEYYLVVDLDTGNRSILPGTGLANALIIELDYDPSRSQLVAVTSSFDQIYTISTTGTNRSILSNAGMSGLPTGNARQILIHSPADRYLVNDYSSNPSAEDTNRLLQVFPTSGGRTIHFSDSHGDGDRISGTGFITLDATRNVVYVASPETDNIISVQIQTGERTTISDDSTGTGADFMTILDIRYDPSSDRIYVADNGSKSLMMVDPVSGNRSVVSSALIGSGPAFVAVQGLELDVANNRAFISDEEADVIYEVDLLTGERSILSDLNNSGPVLISPGGMSLDTGNNRLLLADNGNGSSLAQKLMAVDLTTGDRTTLTAQDTGSGPPLLGMYSVVHIDGTDFAIFAGEDQLTLVDLNTGDRQLLADTDTGNGESIHGIGNMAYDANRDVLYIWSGSFDAMFEVDRITGDHAIVSK